jgi:hypothetical protein
MGLEVAVFSSAVVGNSPEDSKWKNLGPRGRRCRRPLPTANTVRALAPRDHEVEAEGGPSRAVRADSQKNGPGKLVQTGAAKSG